jgi:hypothetical protein
MITTIYISASRRFRSLCHRRLTGGMRIGLQDIVAGLHSGSALGIAPVMLDAPFQSRRSLVRMTAIPRYARHVPRAEALLGTKGSGKACADNNQ